MFLSLSIKATTKTFYHWNKLCSYIPGTSMDLLQVKFGYHQYAPVRPNSFYAEGIYGFHPLFFEKLRIDDITCIDVHDPRYNEYISTPRPTQRPDDHQPLIFYFLFITIPINLTDSHTMIKSLSFPSISSIDKNKNPYHFWSDCLKKIIENSERKAEVMWRHCVTIYVYDWLRFFNEDVSGVLKELHPAHRFYWRNYRWNRHNFSFNTMMRSFYRYYLPKYPKNQLFYYLCHIPFQAFVHNHFQLYQRHPDKLLRKLILKYNLNDYGNDTEIRGDDRV